MVALKSKYADSNSSTYLRVPTWYVSEDKKVPDRMLAYLRYVRMRSIARWKESDPVGKK